MIDFTQAEKLTDEEIVALSIKNSDYFAFIIQRYKLKLFNYVRRLTKASNEDAEDILQNVFLKVYLNLNDFDLDLKFSSWIHTIARNEVISNHRKLKIRAEGNSLPIDDNTAKLLIADFDIRKNIDDSLLRENINKALDKLNEKYREIIVLKFFEEKSYQEISDIIKKPIGTVGSMMNKAKKLFKEELDKK